MHVLCNMNHRIISYLISLAHQLPPFLAPGRPQDWPSPHWIDTVHPSKTDGDGPSPPTPLRLVITRSSALRRRRQSVRQSHRINSHLKDNRSTAYLRHSIQIWAWSLDVWTPRRYFLKFPDAHVGQDPYRHSPCATSPDSF
jgi:hypothetical protein